MAENWTRAENEAVVAVKTTQFGSETPVLCQS
jgi:hypothetical protein